MILFDREGDGCLLVAVERDLVGELNVAVHVLRREVGNAVERTVDFRKYLLAVVAFKSEEIVGCRGGEDRLEIIPQLLLGFEVDGNELCACILGRLFRILGRLGALGVFVLVHFGESLEDLCLQVRISVKVGGNFGVVYCVGDVRRKPGICFQCGVDKLGYLVLGLQFLYHLFNDLMGGLLAVRLLTH